MKSKQSIRAALTLIATASLMLTLTACSNSSALLGTTWGDPDAESTPSLTFDTEGRVHGTDGCNRLMGGWSEKGGEVTFTELASTMRYCEGIDDWLTKSASGTVEGDRLVIHDIYGNEIGSLDKTDG